MTTAEALQPLGKHFYRVEGDTVYLQFHKNLELKETTEFTKIFEGIHAKYHRLFMICDLRHATLIDADARKYFGQWSRSLHLLATASIGANILQRTISMFIMNAIKMFTKGNFVQAFFDNENDARAWLSKQRANFVEPTNKAS